MVGLYNGCFTILCILFCVVSCSINPFPADMLSVDIRCASSFPVYHIHVQAPCRSLFRLVLINKASPSFPHCCHTKKACRTVSASQFDDLSYYDQPSLHFLQPCQGFQLLCIAIIIILFPADLCLKFVHAIYLSVQLACKQ